MPQRFQNDENGYLTWLKDNSNGYVFNFFGGNDSEMNKIHCADCRHLWRPTDEGRRTVIEKVCSSDLKELGEFVQSQRGEVWSYCKTCF